MGESISLYAGGSLGPKFNYYGIGGPAVADVPESIRTVPIHPDDNFVPPGNNGPIPQTDNRTEPVFDLCSLEIGVRIGPSKERNEGEDQDFTQNQGWSLRFGLGADFGTSGIGAHLNERNYMNAPGTATRGYGAALTYYDIGATPVWAQLVITPKVFVEFDRKYLLARAQMLTYQSAINTGWDRYDGLERRDSYNLGTTVEGQALAGVRWGADLSQDSHAEFRLYGGVAYSKLFRSDLGQTVGVKTSGIAPVAAFEIEYTYDLFSHQPSQPVNK